MSLDTQFVTLLSMIAMGLSFGAAFDTYNRFLKRAKRALWIVFINDVLFWCMQAMLIFFVLFKANAGEWRFYIVLALLLGYSAYQALFKEMYKKVLEGAIHLVLQTIHFFIRLGDMLLLKPVKGMIMLLVSVVLFFLKLVIKLAKGLFMLAMMILKALLSIVGVVCWPVFRLASFLWRIMPAPIRKPCEKFFSKIAGIIAGMKNNIIVFYDRWINRSSE